MTVNIPGIPFPLEPSPGSTWRIDGGDKTLRVSAAPRSDIFVDPAGEDPANAATLMNAVTMLGRAPAGDFQLSARVKVDFRATFDAGVLLLWFDESLWAKFCFEFSPAGDAMVVSVVNRGVADDANSFTVEMSHIWLRVARVGRVFAFHASRDGANWELVPIPFN